MKTPEFLARFFESKAFYGPEKVGNRFEWTVYMRKWGAFDRFWVHCFERGDIDDDGHDHPWPFVTFPLVPYLEEVTTPTPTGHSRAVRLVKAWRFHRRPADYCHRVLGRAQRVVIEADYYDGPEEDHVEHQLVPGRVWTLVYHGRSTRIWGFMKLRDGRWCWQDWKTYVNRGGKHAPCE